MMAEQMGWEVTPENIPLDSSDLSTECQQALYLFNILPDKIEGMNGIWLGKDFSGLMDIMEINSIHQKQEVFELLNLAINLARKYYEQKRKK